MTKKTWIIFSAVCLVIIGGLIFMSSRNKIDVSSIDINQIQSSTDTDGQIADHVFGDAKSKVVLIEYGDYQCPGCGAAYPVIKAVSEKYQAQIAFVFRNFPLPSLHPNARAAAAVAEAAGLSGKFWEMHNSLYESQDSWSALGGADRTQFFSGLASKIGLDGDKLVSQLDSSQIAKKIDFDHALGVKAGVAGTPTFYLNGKKVSDLRFKDGKLSTDSNDPYVWSDAKAFETLVLDPVLKQNGIALPTGADTDAVSSPLAAPTQAN